MKWMKANDSESTLIRNVFMSSMVTMILSNLTTFAGSMVDGVVISRFLGTSCMAAFQLSIPFTLCMVMVSQVFSVGVQNVCAKKLGARKGDEANSAYTTSMILLAAISIAVSVATIIGASGFSRLLGATGEKAELAGELSEYIIGLSFGTPMLCIMPVIISVMFLEGKGKKVMTALLIQTVVDVALDLANVFWFKKGMLGMGIATSVCYYAAFLYILFSRFTEKGAIRMRADSFRISCMTGVFKIGLPAAVDRAYKTIQMLVLNKVLAAVAASAAIAAFGNINTLNNIYNPITSGIGTAVLTMTAVFYGERDKKSISILMKNAVKITLLVEVIVAVVSFVTAPFLMLIFVKSSEADALAIAIRALRIYVLYIPVYGINHILQKYYNSIGNMRMTYILSAFDNLIFICLFAVILGNRFQADGVFLSFFVAEVCTLVSMFFVIFVILKRPPRSVDDFLDLPKDFELSAERHLSVSASNEEEVIAASEEVTQFCKRNGMPSREAMYFALAVEELGMNIVRYGIREKKSGSMDIRLCRGDNWMLRIRDNGGAFDPTNWLSLHEEDEKEKNIGIRMVLSGAKDVSYVNAIKTNCIVIEY